jgi:hypothetical protein
MYWDCDVDGPLPHPNWEEIELLINRTLLRMIKAYRDRVEKETGKLVSLKDAAHVAKFLAGPPP